MPPAVINGRFTLSEEQPRTGGLSQVRKAFDSATGGFVAVKLLNPPEGDNVIDIFLQRETETLAALEHPNIVRLLDSGWAAELGKFYLVLEWVDRSLKDDLDGGRTFGWQEYFDEIGQPLCSALAYAHAKEIEHRDVKPGNVLISHADLEPALNAVPGIPPELRDVLYTCVARDPDDPMPGT